MTGLTFTGLDELRAAMRELPETLTAEASHIIEAAANGAAADIKAAYPVRTGNLLDHLTVTHFDQGRYVAAALVKNTSKHAWLVENGSQARHTAIGANRGSMPPAHVFVPRVMRARRRMYEELVALLERNGLTVGSDGG